MTILELREKPNKAWEAAKAFVETKRDKDGLLSDEDANTYASDVLSEGIDENGGYLVPEEYDSRLIDVLTEENIFRGLANVITTSGQHKINIAGAKPAAARIQEGGELTFGDGNGKPLGLFAETGGAEIGVTAAGGTEITASEIINLLYALKPPLWRM